MLVFRFFTSPSSSCSSLTSRFVTVKGERSLKGPNPSPDMSFSPWASSFLPRFSLLLSVIYLVSNGGVVTTSPLPEPFPSDYQIRQAFLGVRPDETFLTSEIPPRRDLYDRFAARYAPKKSLEDVYPRFFLVYKVGQSGDCYNDFIDRCCRIFAEESSGDVFMLSKWPDGPSDPESLFNAIEYPAFIQNPNVRRIYLVNPNDMSQRIQFWPRDPDDPDRVETAPEDQSLEQTLNALTIGAGAAAGGLELLQPIIGSSLSPFYLPGNDKVTPHNNEEQVPGETRLDSFFVDTASLPGHSEGFDSTQFLSTDGSSAAGDATSLLTTIPNSGTEAFTAEVGDGEANADMTTFATVSGTEPDSLLSTTPDESTDLFGSPAKRQLTLHSRACTLRPGLENDLPFLFDGTNPTSSGEAADPANIIPFPGALPAYATIKVVQRRIPGNPGFYKLDIEIRNSAGQLIGSAVDADAFPNQHIEVQSDIPYRVQVWTQEGDDHQPLKFQYGPTGVEWDSNDSSPETHNCQTDEWREDHRELDCKFDF